MLSIAPSSQNDPGHPGFPEGLIALCGAIAPVRTRDDMNQLLETHLKKRFHFNDMMVFLPGRDKTTQRLFLRLLSMPAAEEYTANDGLFNAVLTASGPVVWE